MDAKQKLETRARAYAAHERACRGFMGVSLPTPPVDDVERIELICSRCATSVRERFTPDEFRQLADAGIVTEDDVRRFVTTTGDTHTS
jgi:hypothetical protein